LSGGGAKVMLATAAAGGKAMSSMNSIIGGQTVNGKLIVIGAPDKSLVVPPVLLLSKRISVIDWPTGPSISLRILLPSAIFRA